MPIPERWEQPEEIIGRWLQQGKRRNKVVIAGKVAGPAPRNNPAGFGRTLDRANIEAALDASLRRLRTDYIDIYQVHWPDRDANRFGQLNYYHAPEKDGAPVSETLEALDHLVQSGKVRHIGISNETPWGLAQYLNLSENRGYARVAVLQNPYNLLNRTLEIGLAEFALREDVSLLAYSPTAFGVLSGKYLHRSRPRNARLTLYPGYKRYTGKQADLAVERYVELARGHGMEPLQMALAYVHSRPFVASTIIGATSLEQLRSNIESIRVKLPREMLRHIEKIHVEQPNPCP